MAACHQLLGQPGHHALGPAIQSGRDAFHQGAICAISRCQTFATLIHNDVSVIWVPFFSSQLRYYALRRTAPQGYDDSQGAALSLEALWQKTLSAIRLYRLGAARVVRDALRRIEKSGLIGAHHFYLTFKTHADGVDIPEFLKEQYPDEMTSSSSTNIGR